MIHKTENLYIYHGNKTIFRTNKYGTIRIEKIFVVRGDFDR